MSLIVSDGSSEPVTGVSVISRRIVGDSVMKAIPKRRRV